MVLLVFIMFILLLNVLELLTVFKVFELMHAVITLRVKYVTLPFYLKFQFRDYSCTCNGIHGLCNGIQGTCGNPFLSTLSGEQNPHQSRYSQRIHVSRQISIFRLPMLNCIGYTCIINPLTNNIIRFRHKTQHCQSSTKTLKNAFHVGYKEPSVYIYTCRWLPLDKPVRSNCFIHRWRAFDHVTLSSSDVSEKTNVLTGPCNVRLPSRHDDDSWT